MLTLGGFRKIACSTHEGSETSCKKRSEKHEPKVIMGGKREAENRFAVLSEQ
jgi:hypothetical protein